ncbi:MAG: hypothetical protein U0232_02380 [Thermomicrobiales bacterium]
MARTTRDEHADLPKPAAATPPTGPRRSRWRLVLTLPALLLALLGVAGLIPTIRSAPPPPSAHEPNRYPSGTGAANRLVIILAPQLGEREIPLLRAALLPAAPDAGAQFAIDRPGFSSFDDISLVLLAGNGPNGVTPPAPADQPPDTLVRSATGKGRRAVLLGPADWRALFGFSDPAPSGSSSPTPATETLLNGVGEALVAGDAPLIIVMARDLNARDLRDEPGNLRTLLAQLGAQLGPSDALLLVGGGGTIGESLHLSLGGAGIKQTPLRTMALNDIAPTCAVLLGLPYPSEVRGRISWSVLVADERRKAIATSGLARQRTWLAISAVPFGAQYPASLRVLASQLAEADAEIAQSRYDYGYQLSSSNLEQADRQLVALAGVAPLPTPRRAAWGLVIPCLVAALLAIGAVALVRAWGTLGAAAAGATTALILWSALAIFLQRAIVPNLLTVVALTAAHTLCGGLVSAWLARRWSRPRPRLAIDLLVLLAAFPAAICAYRYGLPWRLRLEESAPLFLWRSALLAPLGLLLTGYLALWFLQRRAATATTPTHQEAI